MTRQKRPERTEFVELLEYVAVAANEATDVASALRAVIVRVCSHHGLVVGHALVVEPEGLRSTGIWHLGDSGFEGFRSVSEAMTFPFGVGLPGRVLASRSPAWIDDVRSDVNFPRVTMAGAAGLRAAFAFPVLVGSEVVAVLEFFSTEPAAPQPSLLEVMGHVGTQLGRVFERERAAAVLRRSEERLRQILDSAGDAFVAMDSEGRVTDWNRAAEAVFGWSRQEVLGRSVAEVMIPPAYREAHRAGLERFVTTATAHVIGQRLELPALHREGHEFPVEITLWGLSDETGPSFYAFGRDISDRKRAEAILQHRALHDELTGLPNRTFLLDRLAQMLTHRAAGSGDSRGVAVLFVDLDRFKAVNDSLGHDAGDQLLLAVARRLEAAVRPTDTVARLSGDEFVVICDDVSDVTDATAAAERLCDALAEPIGLETDLVHVTASVGIALADETTTSPEALLQAADVAMYRAKQEGRARFKLVDDAMRSRMLKRLRTQSLLAQAVERDELRLHYQPIVSIDGGRLLGVEALLRWQHPDDGLLLPASFLELAEDSGLIVPIGEWVLSEACRQARRWEAELDIAVPLEIAVNLSSRQLAQSDFACIAEGILDEAGLDPSRVHLCLEITETLVMRDPVTAAAVLEALRAHGFRIAIDDFGTGHSSLAYLKKFPVDTVKIDRSFIAGVDSDSVDRAIVSAIIDLAHALGMAVTAEGVETPGQLECLRSLGCDRAQGFLFARPRPPEHLTRDFAAWSDLAALLG